MKLIERLAIVALIILAIVAYHVLTAGSDTYGLPIGPNR
jgi:hypothetical protein